MSEEIADEVKMILELPGMGQMMGVLFILIGILQICFIPIKNFITRQCCTNHRKVSDKSVNEELNPPPPEVSPLLSKKPRNGIVLFGDVNRNVLRS